jgi:2-phospho-L-lactate/phosphoenolpyruvate guanylyltransferase
MRVVAVPVKALEYAKTRLSPVLTSPERAALTLAMLEDVLDACLAQEGWKVWVISPADQVLRLAARRGARPILESRGSLLGAVEEVERRMRGAQSELAVLLADLPLLSAPGLARALALSPPAGVVAAPASSDGGTNLLLRRPPVVIPARFGRSSFVRHRTEAYRRGVTFRSVRIPELGFDLDRPADFGRVLADPRLTRTRTVCLDMGLAERLGASA